MNPSPMHCAMTGIEIRDSGDGIWDDGEWISWAWINEQIEIQENGRPTEEYVDEEFDDEAYEPSYEILFRILEAKKYYENTNGQISPDWGSLGEDFIAERYNVKLCSRYTEGHDGRRGDDLIEIKTISPHKKRAVVTVKRAGNFNVLAVVRVTSDYRLEVRFVRRELLSKGDGGKRIVVTWNTACKVGAESLRGPHARKGKE